MRKGRQMNGLMLTARHNHMTKMIRFCAAFFAVAFVTSIALAGAADARGRTGSSRVGGYTSHGKGSHYVGGH